MRKVIGGVRYDTDTAVEVESWSHGYPGDFNRCEETLYRTKSGRYFVCGEGGANTRWRTVISQNTWCGGEGIEAKTPEEALEWLECHDCDVPADCPEIAALVIDG
jgi:hypothetical protein